MRKENKDYNENLNENKKQMIVSFQWKKITLFMFQKKLRN